MPIKFYYRPRRISIKSFVHDVPCSFYAIVEDADEVERPLPRGETLHAYSSSSSILDYGHNHQFALPPSNSSRSLPLPPNSSVFDRRQHSIRINNACAQVVRRYNSILNVIDGERNEIYQERVDPRGKLN